MVTNMKNLFGDKDKKEEKRVDEIVSSFTSAIVYAIKTNNDVKKIFANISKSQEDIGVIMGRESSDEHQGMNKALASYKKEWCNEVPASLAQSITSVCVAKSCGDKEDLDLLIKQLALASGLVGKHKDSGQLAESRYRDNPEFMLFRGMQLLEVDNGKAVK